MIDEELYQQAADELNTDRRRAHIWARACALASDDHDEARYLYTNLRVEELIAERDAGGGAASSAADPFDGEHDKTLSLEPIALGSALDDDSQSMFNSDDEFTLGETDDIPSSISSPAGMDSRDDSDDLFELLPTELESGIGSVAAGTSTFGDTSDLDNFDTRIAGASEPPPESPMERDFREKAERPTLDDTFDNTAELDGTAILDVDGEELAEFQAAIPAEEYDSFEAQAAASLDNSSDMLLQNDDELSNLLDGVYPPSESAGQGDIDDDNLDAVLTADFSDASGTQAILIDEELDWLDDQVAKDSENKLLEPYQPAALDHDDTDRLTQELVRQADEMPGQHSDVVAFTTPAQPDISPATVSQTDTDQAGDSGSLDVVLPESTDSGSDVAAAAFTAAAGATAAGAVAMASNSDAATDATGVRASAHTTETSRGHNLAYPIDLSENGSGARYTVYRRDQRLKAIKSGVSWSALFLTLPFLIYRQLFGTAIVYTVMSAILLAGLLIMGLAWYDAGAAATPLIKGGTFAFGFLAVIGLLYMPFRYGNEWRGEKLENRGFELVAWVRAKNPGKAITQARREAALD